MIDQIKQTTDFLANRMPKTPKIGMITGTGLGSLTDKIKAHFRLSYKEIPNFPVSTIQGHKGSLVSGELKGKEIVALQGRFHLYEGYTAQEITYPIRVMSLLGVKYLFISSAAGGLNPQFERGDVMVVTDHINLTAHNPLIGPNIEELGPRFPDMAEAYDPKLKEIAKAKALESRIPLREGTYVGVLGPSLETPAETRFLRMIGGDAVGMSTVLEAIVGAHCGLRTTAIVAITNVNLPDCMEKKSLEDVLSAAQETSSKLALLWEGIINELLD